MQTSAKITASLLTSPARGGIAVIALRGKGAKDILQKIFSPYSKTPFEKDTLHLGKIHHHGEVFDEAIVAIPADDIVEINIHGSTFIAGKVLSLLAEYDVEIFSDNVIDPTLSLQHSRYNNPAITVEMLSALRMASTPLAIAAITAQWWKGLSELISRTNPPLELLQNAADAFPLMQRLINPAEVVIAGPPNAGKSALNNALVGREVSIVTDIAGTTRDWVRSLTSVKGIPIWLTDTAGLWTSAKGIDAEAVNRAWIRVESADIIIVVVCPEEASRQDGGKKTIDRLFTRPNVIKVFNKCDIAAPAEKVDVITSATKFIGIDELRQAIVQKLGFENFSPTAPMAFTKRQLSLLTSAIDAFIKDDSANARNYLNKILHETSHQNQSLQ